MMQPSDLDRERLSRWLQGNVPELGVISVIVRFDGGQSNPTYLLETPDARFVLRRKPFGNLLPSAHSIEREYRLLAALHPTGFPVPKPIVMCEDDGVIGSRFYIMGAIDGRNLYDGRLPGQTPQERRAMYEAMVCTLAQLHAIKPADVGLSDFGRPGNYFKRQVERWTSQYRAAETNRIPAMERLISWLPSSIPSQRATCIVHGDYRIDNLIFHRGTPEVAAVLDWELATLGDPLADLAYFLLNWTISADGRSWIGDINFERSGIPRMEEVSALYSRLTGYDVGDLSWYFAFNMFRLAGILQGVKKRMLDGNASNVSAIDAIRRLDQLAQAGWEQAIAAGA